ncbi:hypothetical protein ACFLUY_00860 [Chloroflexota bacterium]
MSIKLYLPRSMSGITKGKDVFEVEGETVGECLSHLVTLIPRIKEELFYVDTEESLATNGMLRSNIEVMVNEKSINAEGLATKVKDSAKIEIKLNIH